MTDGYDEQIRLQTEVTIGFKDVTVDQTGTAAMSRWGINVPLIYTKAYVCYALK